MLARATTALVLLGSSLAAQTTYYVDQANTPPGSGTLNNPYTRIQPALHEPTLGPGDTIVVAPGTYAEPLLVAASGFRMVSSGGPLATTITRTGLGTTIRVEASTDDEVTLDGFTISGGSEGTGYFEFGFRGVTGRSHVTNCIIAGNTKGITGTATRLSRSTVANNDIGAWIGPDTYLEIEDTLFDGNLEDLKHFCMGTSFDISYSIFDHSGLSWCASVGPGGIDADPETWDTPSGDFHLRPGSPAIGASKGGLDIGAVPYDPAYAPSIPTIYCDSKWNSLGCKPWIAAAGWPSVSGGNFDVFCTQTLNNQPGLLFYGYQGKRAPYQGGELCVRAPIRRTPVQSSGGNPPPDDCSGTYSFGFGAHVTGGSDPTLIAGQTVFAQYWYHDPNEPTGWGTGRSSALAFTILP